MPKMSDPESSTRLGGAGRNVGASFTSPAHSVESSNGSRPVRRTGTRRRLSPAIWEKAQHWDGEQGASINVPRVDLPMADTTWPESPAKSITIERAVQAFTSD